MEFNQILELIDHVSASELTAFTYETDDLTLTMEHGKPQIIQGVMGETVENIPAAGMTGGKVRRAVQKTADQVNTEAQNNQWEYYCNEIHEMDNFVKELTDALADYPEDVEWMRRELLDSKEWSLLDEGTLTDAQALERVQKRLPNEHLRWLAKESLEHWHEYNIWAKPGMGELVKELKEKGCGIYLC